MPTETLFYASALCYLTGGESLIEFDSFNKDNDVLADQITVIFGAGVKH